MTERIQAIRGMHDLLPEATARWQYLEQTLRQLMQQYGYKEIRFPIVEKTELFKRTIGEVTDIVEKEMYTFDDRNGESLTLRPEGTAGCVRAGVEHGLLYNQTQRMWYSGSMFRYERPQKGRYRQFHQFGVEAYGFAGPDIDAELILMTARLWRTLGLTGLTLQLNSLGTAVVRQRYKVKLIAYLKQHERSLDEESKRRLTSNPLRVLDSKNAALKSVIEGAPKLIDCLDEESETHFQQLRQILDTAGLVYEVNPCLVRGLDYYSKTVFEWVTDKLGAQGTVCAGGRYDGLVEQLGAKATPAMGFAMGMERLLALLEEESALPDPLTPHGCLVLVGELAVKQGIMLAEQWRDQFPELRLVVNCGGSFKSQMKRADKSQATVALILGDNEINSNVVTIKYLRKKCEQKPVAMNDLTLFIEQLIKA
ncbi:MAG: histidine--tRNA ligase [Gammaproteobacteria bacterium]|nr:histidine--tRNA ligase [Gammaproteobacteria bacterium]